MDLYLQAFVTLAALVNPMMCAIIFLAIEPGRSNAQKIRDASVASVTILVILSLVAFLGTSILGVFGISLDVFSIAGGGVLVWMGFSLLRGAGQDTETKPSLTTLILFAASPGTMTGVITLAVAHDGTKTPVTVLTAICAVTFVAWLMMLLFSQSNSKGGFVRSTIQSFMGLLVMAMGVQFGLKGLTNYIQTAGL